MIDTKKSTVLVIESPSIAALYFFYTVIRLHRVNVTCHHLYVF